MDIFRHGSDCSEMAHLDPIVSHQKSGMYGFAFGGHDFSYCFFSKGFGGKCKFLCSFLCFLFVVLSYNFIVFLRFLCMIYIYICTFFQR